jgi:uncharacterized protein (UPF0333 family)
MKFNNKGQGALEYLLLIGGAVLIAVIVIALLVGMGGQSRDTAKEQADRVQQATDVPQPAQIVSVEAAYADCTANTSATVTVNWRPLGEAGSHNLKILTSGNQALLINSVDGNAISPAVSEYTLNPNELSVTDVVVQGIAACGDSYYVLIETTKNNQTVQSSKYKFSWTN